MQYMPQVVLPTTFTYAMFYSSVDVNNLISGYVSQAGFIFQKNIASVYSQSSKTTLISNGLHKFSGKFSKQNGVSTIDDGTKGTNVSSNTTPIIFGSTIYFGSYGSAFPCHGTLRNIKIWNKGLNDSNLIALTT